MLVTAVSAPPAFSAVPVVTAGGDPASPPLPDPGPDPTPVSGPDPGPDPTPQPSPDPSSGGDVLAPGGTVPGADPDPDSDPAVPADARSGYYVRVSLVEQLVRVYLDGREIRTMVCSAGTAEKPTPTGRFHVQNRGEWFFSEKYQQGAKWWVSFKDWGIYLFHSVPMTRDQEIIPEEAAKLGQPASHGCVRLAVEDARWIYDTIPEGTPVDID